MEWMRYKGSMLLPEEIGGEIALATAQAEKEQMESGEKSHHEPLKFTEGLGAFLFSTALLLVSFGLVRTLAVLGPPTLETMIRYHLELTLPLFVLGFGYAAHWFKTKSQYWYGCSEVAMATALALNVARGMNPGEPMFSRWAALVGTAYIVARGLSNISDAKKEARVGADSESDKQPS